MKLLPTLFYQQSTVQVARNLIGKELIRVYKGNILSGIITETEAYGGSDDPASHAYKKKTLRNTPMFGPVGHTYVYFTYGMHHCLNIVAKDINAEAGAVLIRGIEPLQGLEIMQSLRTVNALYSLTNGPGKICQALQLTTEYNGIDVTNQGALYIGPGISIEKESDIVSTPRVGIHKATDVFWRFLKKKTIPR